MAVNKLPPPLKRYLMGAYPSHSSRKGLGEAFVGVPPEVVESLLIAGEYVSDEGRPTRKAAEEGLVESCDGKILWNVKNVEQKFAAEGMKLTRVPQNQKVAEPTSLEPQWVNLGTLGTHFSVTANQVGKWLDDLGHREDNEPTDEAVKAGLATFVEMNAGGKKTRKVTHWNLHLTRSLLMEAGHVLDFNYEETMKGKGRNGDVETGSVEQRAQEFAREFAAMFRSGATRHKCFPLVQKTPKAIIIRAEAILKRPGFITSGKYRDF